MFNVMQSRTSLHGGDVLGNEPNEREKQCLAFCENHAERIKRALNKTYKDGREIGKIDETRKELSKLMPAKLALS